MFLGLAESKEVMKEFMAVDTTIQEMLDEIKSIQQGIKDYVEDKKPDLVREIKAYQTDIKLACKAAAKGSEHKPAELKTFFAARAAERVKKVVAKGEAFQQLESEID